MNLAINTNISGYQPGDIRKAVSYALSAAVAQARQRLAYYTEKCQDFEQHFGMNSDEFTQQFEAGVLGDAQAYFDWYAAKRGHDIWRERYEILSGVSV